MLLARQQSNWLRLCHGKSFSVSDMWAMWQYSKLCSVFPLDIILVVRRGVTRKIAVLDKLFSGVLFRYALTTQLPKLRCIYLSGPNLTVSISLNVKECDIFTLLGLQSLQYFTNDFQDLLRTISRGLDSFSLFIVYYILSWCIPICIFNICYLGFKSYRAFFWHLFFKNSVSGNCWYKEL